MPCLNPKTILNPRYKEGGRLKRDIYCREYFGYDNCLLMRGDDGLLDYYPPDWCITVPCGRCAECRKSKRNQWAIRLLNEMGLSNN